MVYRLLGRGVVGGAYHKIQDSYRLFHVLVQKLFLILNNGISA